MKVEILYVHHNCFVLTLPDRTLLFDYPSAAHRPEGVETLVHEAIQGKPLYIFISHSHPDHFCPNTQELGKLAESTKYILSFDIPEMYPEFDPEEGMENALIVEPEERYALHDMEIVPYESTDLGVGFLIRLQGKSLYFGGDVAEWAWPKQNKQALAFSVNHFQETLRSLAKEGVDLAFSNADQRLANWAGGEKFLREVQPRFFVPMHAFGDTGSLATFVGGLGPGDSHVLLYTRSGETMSVEL